MARYSIQFTLGKATMSYDFRLCLPEAGLSREEIATADLEDLEVSDPDPSKEERKKRVAAALIAKNPMLEPFAFDFEEIAIFEKITVDEAKIKHRHVELNGPANNNGIQIVLFDNEVSVTVPYWHQGAAARRVFEEIWTYLEIVQREGGYFAYDPQIEREVDLKTDFEASLACYDRVSRDIARKLPERPLKKWWEFWK